MSDTKRDGAKLLEPSKYRQRWIMMGDDLWTCFAIFMIGMVFVVIIISLPLHDHRTGGWFAIPIIIFILLMTMAFTLPSYYNNAYYDVDHPPPPSSRIELDNWVDGLSIAAFVILFLILIMELSVFGTTRGSDSYWIIESIVLMLFAIEFTLLIIYCCIYSAITTETL